MSSKKPIVYLAGGMERAGENGKIWRRDITPHLKALGYDVWNPYKEEVKVGISTKSVAALKRTNYTQYLFYIRRIIKHDIEHLLQCSLVVTLIDQSVLNGAGTFGELTYCFMNDIPVHAWIDLPANEYGVPSWAMGCVTEFKINKKSFYDSIPNAEVFEK